MTEQAADKFAINLEDLDLADLADFEEASGLDAMEVLESGRPSIKALTVLFWIAQRKSNPEFTLEDARSTKITDLEVKGVNDIPPTEGGS